MSKTAIIIPARYGSKRLQGKPLLKVCNKPIIQWVWERAIQVASADMVIIAIQFSQESRAAIRIKSMNNIFESFEKL